jgi:hypothetical protein
MELCVAATENGKWQVDINMEESSLVLKKMCDFFEIAIFWGMVSCSLVEVY